MFVLVNLILLLGVYALFDVYSLNKRPIADHLLGDGKGVQRSTSQTATSWLLGIQMFLLSIILVFCGSVFYQTNSLNSPIDTIEDLDYWFVGINLKKIPTRQERITVLHAFESLIKNDEAFSEVFAVSEPLVNKDSTFYEIYDQESQLIEHARIIDVSPGFFDALGLRVVGKEIDSYKLEDAKDYPIVINKTLDNSLRLYFTDTLKQSVGVIYKDNLHRIMSIVDDVEVEGISTENEPVVYRIRTYEGDSNYTLMLKTVLKAKERKTEKLNTELIRLMREVDSRISVSNINYFEHQLKESHLPFKLISSLAMLLGILVFVIAGVGVYALMSTVVKKQRYEIGVRIALGAVKGRAFFDVASPLLAVVACGLWVALSFIYMIAVVIEVKTDFNVYLDFTLLLQSAVALASLMILMGMVLPYKVLSSDLVN